MEPARIAVVTFPGSNDDGDARLALEALGAVALPLWHTERELPPGVGGLVLPGGFSYGDYLRCGALARVAPVMEAVRTFAADGGPVIGICNGFQILCEAGLLPGALRANRQLEFVCADVALTVESTETPFTAFTTREALRNSTARSVARSRLTAGGSRAEGHTGRARRGACCRPSARRPRFVIAVARPLVRQAVILA